MKTVENLQKVALALFLTLGIIHILSGLMLSSGYFLPYTVWINRTLDIPFALTALAYGFSALYVKIEEPHRPKARILFAITGLLIFLILLYINLLIPDKSTLLLTTP